MGAAVTSAPIRVLIVDDEPALVELVSRYLRREGFEVSTAADGERAIELARQRDPQVVVLDLMLPGLDGLEVARRLREFSDAYIVMLSARVEEVDRVVGLSVGADDYMTKPFSPRELVARISAMMRRPRHIGPAHDSVRRLGPLGIDLETREVSVNGQPVELTRLEFELLVALSARPRAVLTSEQLMDQVWGTDLYDNHLVAVHIANLRRKLGDDSNEGGLIETVRGVGYRLAVRP
jgi:DNA-binding response OmpR family regulator